MRVFGLSSLLSTLTGNGVSIGVALHGGREAAVLLAIDCAGVLWAVCEGTRRDLVRWCLGCRLYVYPRLSDLVGAVLRCECCGLLCEAAPSVAVPWDGCLPMEGA